LLYDPQTAGGLLIAVNATDSDRLVHALKQAEIPAVQVGEALPQRKPLIEVAK